jgi:hypothetical protein
MHIQDEQGREIYNEPNQILNLRKSSIKVASTIGSDREPIHMTVGASTPA